MGRGTHSLFRAHGVLLAIGDGKESSTETTAVWHSHAGAEYDSDRGIRRGASAYPEDPPACHGVNIRNCTEI